MSIGNIERYASYYSTQYYPIYMQYKLKEDLRYARRRYCSLEMLSAQAVKPVSKDYVLSNLGILEYDHSITHMIESEIEVMNSNRNNSVSVGDVIVVLQDGDRYFYYVDPVGLKVLNTF